MELHIMCDAGSLPLADSSVDFSPVMSVTRYDAYISPVPVSHNRLLLVGNHSATSST